MGWVSTTLESGRRFWGMSQCSIPKQRLVNEPRGQLRYLENFSLNIFMKS